MPQSKNNPFLIFEPADLAGQKTHRWDVLSVRGKTYLGTVKWEPKWRKYIFSPVGCTIWDEKCLAEIAVFIVARTEEHKRG